MNTTKTTVAWKSLTPRERDALVAEKVMGIKNIQDIILIDGKGPRDDVGTVSEPYRMADGRMGVKATKLKSYTTSIADAFEVVEKMQEKGFPFSCTDSSKDGLPRWIVRFSVFSGGADTFMDACCLSALRACGVEVQA